MSIDRDGDVLPIHVREMIRIGLSINVLATNAYNHANISKICQKKVFKTTISPRLIEGTIPSKLIMNTIYSIT